MAAKTIETVKDGDRVKVEYTGKLKDGTIFDSSKGREPLSFKVGANMVIPGFEKAVNGLKLNQEKTFTIPCNEAYGPIRPELKMEIPRNKLPKDPEPKPGMMLVMKAPDGHQVPAKIAKVDGEKVIIDVNHPLAGQDLTFEIKIVGINLPEEADDCGCSEQDCSGCAGGCGGH